MIIDTNVNLFRWPFRRLPGDDPQGLVTRLRQKGVGQAWAGSFEALLCRDIGGVNLRLAAACREFGKDFLVPFGCVNPKLPDWEEELRRCHEVHRMPGVRLYPGYHGYTLADPELTHLLSLAASRGLMVQIALSMEDPRTQSPMMIVPPTDPTPLADLVPRLPKLRLLLLNAGYWGGHATPEVKEITQANNVYFDMAMNEGIGGLSRLLDTISPERIVFGSHFPFFYFESALLKVKSAGLPRDQEAALYEGNARRLLAGA
ncbi:MAG: amidohydrolase family protein [Acidobacteria bacterium]|nr:amidohydrolase family protein [Acidobacteriota bacterium]